MNLKMIFAVLTGLNLGVIFMNMPPALDELMFLYGVSYARISILLSALLWSQALMQIPAGMMTDRLGVRWALITSFLFMSLGNIVPAFLPNYELAIFGRVITGIGTGLSFASIMKLVAIYAPGGKIGTYQAFFAGFFSIGSIISYLFIPCLVDSGWQWIYIMPGVLSLPFLAMIPALRLRSETPGTFSPLYMGRIISSKEGWILGICHALSFGSMLTIGNWVPSLMAEISKEVMAIGFTWGGALVMLTSGIGRLFGGFLLMRFSPLKIVRGSMAILSTLFLLLFLIHYPLPALSLALLASWFASINFGAVFQLAARLTVADSYATLFGFINFLANIGAIFTLLFGFMKDMAGSFTWGFAVLSIIALAAYIMSKIGLCVKSGK
jgi:MFS family permease